MIETVHETPEADWTTETDDHLERLDNEWNKTEDKIAKSQRYDPEEMKLAGCLVTINFNGKTEISRGLVRRQDQKKLEALRYSESNQSQGDDNHRPETAADNPHKLSNALREDLITYRLNIVKSYLARHPTLARALADYTLCRGALTEDFYMFESPLHISAEETRASGVLHKPDTNRCIERLAEIRESLPMEWLHAPSDAESFDAFCELTQADRDHLVAFATALTLNPSMPGGVVGTTRDPVEAVIARLEIPWHSEFKPTADNYFSRVDKATLIAIGRQFYDDEWAAEAEKRSKKLLASDLEAICAGEDQEMADDKRAEAIDWYPPILTTGGPA
jgi:ParB family chromosome partitioning protein